MADWPLSKPSVIRLDLFPACVSRQNQGAYTNRARVIVTDRDFYVFLDAQGGPVCDVSGVLYDTGGDNRAGYTITLDDQSIYTVKRSENCGCGSMLRGFRPFPGVPLERF